MFLLLLSHGKLPLGSNTSKYISQANYPNNHGTEKLTDQSKMLKSYCFLNHLKTYREKCKWEKGQANTFRIECKQCGKVILPDYWSLFDSYVLPAAGVITKKPSKWKLTRVNTLTCYIREAGKYAWCLLWLSS